MNKEDLRKFLLGIESFEESYIAELSGIQVTEKCLYCGVRRISTHVTCSRRRRGKSSEWLAQLGIRAAVAYYSL